MFAGGEPSLIPFPSNGASEGAAVLEAMRAGKNKTEKRDSECSFPAAASETFPFGF